MRLGVVLLITCLAAGSSASAQAGSHCTADEESIWSCSSRGKVYEVCASKDLGSATGYLQYRAGRPGKPEFSYPVRPAHPQGVFQYTLLARGAQLSFTSGQYRYDISEPLQGDTRIWAAKSGKNAAVAVTCRTSSDTLTLTSTINRFKSLGMIKETEGTNP